MNNPTSITQRFFYKVLKKILLSVIPSSFQTKTEKENKGAVLKILNTPKIQLFLSPCKSTTPSKVVPFNFLLIVIPQFVSENRFPVNFSYVLESNQTFHLQNLKSLKP